MAQLGLLGTRAMTAYRCDEQASDELQQTPEPWAGGVR